MCEVSIATTTTTFTPCICLFITVKNVPVTIIVRDGGGAGLVYEIVLNSVDVVGLS